MNRLITTFLIISSLFAFAAVESDEENQLDQQEQHWKNNNAEVVEEEDPVAQQDWNNNNAEAVGEEEKDPVVRWNKYHCIVMGCKPMTDKLYHLRNIVDDPRYDTHQKTSPLSGKTFMQRMKTRNKIIDPLYPHPNENYKETASDVTKALPPIFQEEKKEKNIDYLGVMLDIEHYFPIWWIKNLLKIMHTLGYNLLQVRLAGDDEVVIPDLFGDWIETKRVEDGRDYYTSSQWKDLVDYAMTLNIVIIPELSLPSPASWGISTQYPNLLLPCPSFFCQNELFGIPLNVSHPDVSILLETVFTNIVQVFHTAPYYHLGGLGLSLSGDCIAEALGTGMNVQTEYLNDYETLLAKVLKKVQIPHSKIIRYYKGSGFENSGKPSSNQRDMRDALQTVPHLGGTAQYFIPMQEQVFALGGLVRRRSVKSSSDDETDVWVTVPQEGSNAVAIIEEIQRISSLQVQRLRGITVETYGLNMEQWTDYNVVGKLLAVAMGTVLEPPTKAIAEEFDRYKDEDKELMKMKYQLLCIEKLHWDERLCELNGAIILTQMVYDKEISMRNKRIRNAICDRLTNLVMIPVMTRTSKIDIKDANTDFWNQVGMEPQFAEEPLLLSPSNTNNAKKIFGNNDEVSSPIPHVGLLLDLIQIEPTKENVVRILELLNRMNELRLNTLQLRVVSDIGFAVNLPHKEINRGSIGSEIRSRSSSSKKDLHWTKFLTWGTVQYKESSISKVIDYAMNLGIQVIPEITTVTRAGGWHRTGTLMNCPLVMCDANQRLGMAANASDPDLVVYTVNVLLSLLEQFKNPPYIHLGYDEREQSRACYEEALQHSRDTHQKGGKQGFAYGEDNLGLFEQRLQKALDYQDIPETKLIRWENTEQVIYPHRAGDVTHHRFSSLSTTSGENDASFFTSTGLNFREKSTSAWDIYQSAQNLVSSKENMGNYPTGIIAMVDVVNDKSWKSFDMDHKIIAFGLGIHDKRKFSSEEQFNILLDKICTSLSCNNTTLGTPYRDPFEYACNKRSHKVPENVLNENYFMKKSRE